ncbi:TPA: type IV secretion system protein [Pseudomonas aeruginosa]|nr:type IV secretion system protein [Pseudomonas aeruginosa]MBN0168080.1 type IV secretion system protein [Pseudomonas aeruginosa]MBN0697558.1 type IV secretion system protein [Pseudomonas aeruginosa]MBN0795244.1 type IV secretion system protein [Pseudomonas aeruginosa]MBN0948043.1 type IV secretion system protein [Pseudomonas aeruginosa]
MGDETSSIQIEVAGPLYSFVDSALQSMIMVGMAKVMLVMGGVFGTFWLVHLMVRAIRWLWMGLDVPFQEVSMELIKIAFLISIAFNVGRYWDLVVPFVQGLPLWMAKTLSGSSDVFTNQVDALISDFFTAVVRLVKKMNFNPFNATLSDIFLAGLTLFYMMVGGIPFLLIAVGTLVTLKVLTTVILVVGPLFIAFAIFPQTRQWFWGWVGVLGGFMLAQVLFSVILGLEMRFINEVLIRDGNIPNTFRAAISILFFFSAFAAIALEIPNHAATIMGGAPTSAGGGLGGLVKRGLGLHPAMRMARGLAGAGRRLLSRARGNRIS